MLTPKKSNRRKITRFEVNIDGYYFYQDDWIKCKIYDLNINGACLWLKQFFVIGDIIKVRFGLTENESNTFNTVVANVNGPRIGIKFANLDEFDRAFINKVISANSKYFKI